MKRLYKRLTAAGLVVVLGMTGMAVMNTAGCGSSEDGVPSTETGETAADEAYRRQTLRCGMRMTVMQTFLPRRLCVITLRPGKK